MTHGRRALWSGALIATPVFVGLIYAGLGATDLVGAGSVPPSLARVSRVLGDREIWRGTLWSLWVATASTIGAVVLAVAVATLFRGEARSDRVARALFTLPLPIPHLVAAIGALLVLGQSGYLARVLTATGVIAGSSAMPTFVADAWGTAAIATLIWKEAPFLALIATAVLATQGRAYEEVARTHGATPRQTFRQVTWPLLWRGLAPGMVAVGTFAFGSYETLVFLAPSNPLAYPLLTAERYVDPDLNRRNDAFVMVLIGVALAGLAVFAHERLRARWAQMT